MRRTPTWSILLGIEGLACVLYYQIKFNFSKHTFCYKGDDWLWEFLSDATLAFITAYPFYLATEAFSSIKKRREARVIQERFLRNIRRVFDGLVESFTREGVKLNEEFADHVQGTDDATILGRFDVWINARSSEGGKWSRNVGEIAMMNIVSDLSTQLRTHRDNIVPFLSSFTLEFVEEMNAMIEEFEHQVRFARSSNQNTLALHYAAVVMLRPRIIALENMHRRAYHIVPLFVDPDASGV
jgi:hypothetical protein